MEQAYRVVISEKARFNVDSITAYLETNVSHSVSVKVRFGIIDAINSLQRMPQRHGVLQGVGGIVEYRRILKWSYKIIFHIDESLNEVVVVMVGHVKEQQRTKF